MFPAILNLNVDFYKIEENDEALKIAPIFLVPLLIILIFIFPILNYSLFQKALYNHQ